MKLYYFSQWQDPYDMFDGFTVIAKNKKQAWELIQQKMNQPQSPEETESPADWEEFVDDYSKYEIEEYPLDKPICIAHFSRG